MYISALQKWDNIISTWDKKVTLALSLSWGKFMWFLSFSLSLSASLRQKRQPLPPLEFLRPDEVFTEKTLKAECLRRQHVNREQRLLAVLYLQGTEVTQARRLPAVTFPVLTMYVNCMPWTFIIKSAGLHFWDEGWKVVFTPGTHLPLSLYGNEAWSLFTAGLWSPKWGYANRGKMEA